MHAATMVLQGLAMVALPVAAITVVRRMGRVPAAPVLAGAAAFFGSQVVHIPLNAAVAWFGPPLSPEVAAWLVPVALGLSAGLCEETARWISLRRCRTAWTAAATGIGHGGFEAAILGMFALLAAVQIAALDPATLPEASRAQVEAVLATPDAAALIGVYERAMAMTCHLGMSMMVGLAVVRRWPVLWVASVLFHAALDTGAVALMSRGAVVDEGYVGLLALLAVGIVVAVARTWPPEPAPAAPPAPPPPTELHRRPLDPRDATIEGIE